MAYLAAIKALFPIRLYDVIPPELVPIEIDLLYRIRIKFGNWDAEHLHGGLLSSRHPRVRRQALSVGQK